MLGNAQHACGDLVDAVQAWRQAADLHGHTGDPAGVVRRSGKVVRLSGKIDSVPAFYQEIVPVARSWQETGAQSPRSWPAEEERARPLGGKSTSD